MSRKTFIYIALTIFSTIGLFIYFNTTQYCAGCGGCDYMAFNDQVMITKGRKYDDTIHTIYLQSIKDTLWHYQIDKTAFDALFNPSQDTVNFKYTANLYKISGSRITKGTCAPYMIDSIRPIK